MIEDLAKFRQETGPEALHPDAKWKRSGNDHQRHAGAGADDAWAARRSGADDAASS